MSDPVIIRNQVNAASLAWRMDATHLVLIILSVVGLPLIASAMMGKLILLSWQARWIALAAYCGLLVALCLPQRFLVGRAAMLLCSLYVLAFAQLAFGGLAGHGRIAVLTLPLLALVLLGPREGWIAAAITTIALGGATWLAGNGTLARWQIINENSLEPGYWVMQVAMLLCALIALMVLFTKFLALQTRTMTAEHEARRQLEAESSRRRGLEGEILRVGDQERSRLGAELHDGLGQDLLVISSQAQLSLCQENNPATTTVRLREIIETTKQALEHTRRLAHNLRPGLLDELGFTKAVGAMVQKVAKASGLSIAIELAQVDGLLPPEAELNLFRITQEALNNVLKHARASQVNVSITREVAGIRLVVQDNGAGFDFERQETTSPIQRGFGLHQIVVRANIIHARLEVVSSHGQGTRVTVEVPIKPCPEMEITTTEPTCHSPLPSPS